MMYLLFLLIPIVVFFWFVVARAILLFTFEYDDRWWAFPLYISLEMSWVFGTLFVVFLVIRALIGH